MKVFKFLGLIILWVFNDTFTDLFITRTGGCSVVARLTNYDLTNSFVGVVATTDSVNPNNILGTEAYPVTDWFDFSNPFRMWGLNNGAFPVVGDQGPCNAGTYSPNFGYYQGDGALSSGTCRFNSGATVQNVKMYGYTNNGG